MKFTELRALEKHLVGAAPAHFLELYLVMGGEPVQREEAVSLLLRTLSSSEKAVRKFAGKTAGEKELMAELGGLSLFAEKRVLYVSDAELLSKKVLSRIERYLTSPNPSVYLILSFQKLLRSSTFYKQAEKSGIVLDHPEEKPWEKRAKLEEWAKRELQKRGKQIEPSALALLLSGGGMNRALLSTELDKIACFLGARAVITPADIEALCMQGTSFETLWQLGDALFSGNKKQALQMVHAALHAGTSPFALLRQLRSQFQKGCQLSSLLHKRAPDAEIARLFPKWRGQILERHKQRARAYGLERFKQGIIEIDRTEFLAKDVMIDLGLLVDRLLVYLS